ncbi:MAG: hypothetical protein J7M26_04050 [Armatimonadetes bacterium]|nr:hypothetical protein [Armatimonadota bacterium]
MVESVAQVLSSQVIQNLTAAQIQAAVEAELRDLRHQEDRLRQRIKSAAADLRDSVSLYRHGELGEAAFHATKTQIEQDIEGAEEELAKTEQRRKYLVADKTRIERARNAAKHFEMLWHELDTEERRGILQALIEDITVYREGRRSIRLVIKFHLLPAVERLIRPMTNEAMESGLAGLTERELAFLELWERGLRYREIAEQFDVSYAASRQMAYSIRRKLGIRDLDKAVAITKQLRGANMVFLPLSGRVRRRPGDRITFSPTEQRVLSDLVRGMSYEEISLRWGLSRQVVGNTAYAIRGKLRASTNEEAVRLAREHGLVTEQ